MAPRASTRGDARGVSTGADFAPLSRLQSRGPHFSAIAGTIPHRCGLSLVHWPLASARQRGRRARRCGRGRLRRTAGVGRSPQGCQDPGGDPGAGEALGGVALALGRLTHHAIPRLPPSATFPSGCVYSVGVFGVFARERNALHGNRLAVYTYPLLAGVYKGTGSGDAARGRRRPPEASRPAPLPHFHSSGELLFLAKLLYGILQCLHAGEPQS